MYQSSHHLASQLELNILTSESVHWPTPSPPYESCCIVDERFMLLGHAVRGVEVMDLQQQAVKPRTILWIRVRQMIINKPCRVILMIAGRNKRVRCYSLDAIRKLCYAIYRINWQDRYEPEFDLPSISDWRFIASLSGRSIEEAPNNDIPPPQSSTRRSAPQSSSSAVPDELVLAGGLASKQHYLCNNVALQDYHYKLSECKDVLRMDLYQTSAFIFVSAMQKDKLVVWQHRRSDQDKPWRLTPMYKFKVYWIPAEPRWVSFADDRIALRYLLAVFSTEATAIGLRNSKVHTVPVDKKLTELYQTGWLRAQLDDQQQQQQQQQQTPPLRSRSHSTPQSPSLPTSISNSNNNSSNVPPSTSFPDLTLTSPPVMQWTSLIQLPFYPSTIAANTLTTEYSNPPSYDTVVTCSPLEAAEPVALSSTTSPQLFFATLGCQSYIIDLSGRLFSTQAYAWTHEPQHIEFIQLGQQQNMAANDVQHVDTDQDWCVVGFSRESVEILRFRTGERVHRIMNGVSICFLGRWNSSAKHNRPKALFWSCATPQDMSHVYMLQHK